MKKTWWMIEKHIDGNPHWWVRHPYQNEYWDNPGRWTTDPNLGRKYDTRAEAEYVIGCDMVGCVATEHSYIEIEDAPVNSDARSAAEQASIAKNIKPQTEEKKMYTVTFADTQNVQQISHYFQTIKAARSWAKWLSKQRFAKDVKIWCRNA